MVEPAGDKEPFMAGKTCNKGDRIKGALVFEALWRAICTGQSWIYVESHAGAGLYFRKDGHVKVLKDAVAASSPEYLTPGSIYHNALKSWWGLHEYAPGSPMLAGCLEQSGFVVPYMRFLERDPDAFKTLSAHLRPWRERTEFKRASFQDELDWLCTNGRTILLVDPWYYSPENPDEGGGLGLVELKGIQERLVQQNESLLFVWTWKNGDKLIEDYRRLSEGTDTLIRAWRIESRHGITLMGAGTPDCGRSILESLPDRRALQASWLGQEAGLEFVPVPGS